MSHDELNLSPLESSIEEFEKDRVKRIRESETNLGRTRKTREGLKHAERALVRKGEKLEACLKELKGEDEPEEEEEQPAAPQTPPTEPTPPPAPPTESAPDPIPFNQDEDEEPEEPEPTRAVSIVDVRQWRGVQWIGAVIGLVIALILWSSWPEWPGRNIDTEWVNSLVNFTWFIALAGVGFFGGAIVGTWLEERRSHDNQS